MIADMISSLLSGGAGGTVKKIFKAIKSVLGFISGFAKDGSDADSINDNSSLENIDRITEIFSDFKEQVCLRSTEIEKAITEEVRFYLDEIKQLLIENQKMAEKYNIRVNIIERKINRILPHLEGIIGHEVSKKISLDNTECKNIMKMIPGEKKEKALQKLLNDAIQNALNVCCLNIKERLEEIFEGVDDEILEKINSIKENNDFQLKQLEEIDADNFTETAAKTMGKAYFWIDACMIVEDILQEA